MRTFLHLFARHLPCPMCRKHFQALLARSLDDAALTSRASLVAFLNDAHNEVNMRLGKRVWTLDEHNRAYSARRGGVRYTPLVIAAGFFLMVIVLRRFSMQEQINANEPCPDRAASGTWRRSVHHHHHHPS